MISKHGLLFYRCQCQTGQRCVLTDNRLDRKAYIFQCRNAESSRHMYPFPDLTQNSFKKWSRRNFANNYNWNQISGRRLRRCRRRRRRQCRRHLRRCRRRRRRLCRSPLQQKSTLTPKNVFSYFQEKNRAETKKKQKNCIFNFFPIEDFRCCVFFGCHAHDMLLTRLPDERSQGDHLTNKTLYSS